MKLLRILPLLAIFSCFGQNKLGKVTVAELKEDRHPTDTSAPAAILFKECDITYKPDAEGYWMVFTEVKVKIKIYKKVGYEYANFEKDFYSGTNAETLFITDAATYNLVDGKVVKTKIKSEGEFLLQKEKDVKTRKISLPNVKEGSIIEYKYEKSSYNFVDLDDFYFQYAIPAKEVRFRARIPEFFDYNRVLTGSLTFERKDEKFVGVDGAYSEFRTTFIFKDVPALNDERYVNNIDNYRSRLRHELAFTTDRQGARKEYATNWQAVATSIYKLDDFGAELKRDNYYEQDLAALLAGLTTPQEKTNAVFRFVQNRMNWNEYNGFLCRDGVRAAYKAKTGNVADINLILTAMLRSAGIEANPVLLSTRANGIMLFPSRTAFNYVVAGIETPNGVQLLDATSKNASVNILPVRALNWFGHMIRKDGTAKEIDLVPSVTSSDMTSVQASISVDGKVLGKVREQHSDYFAMLHRERFRGSSSESIMDKIESRFDGIEVSDYKSENVDNLDKPVLETFSFTTDNVVEAIGGKLYFSPLLFFASAENPFKQEKRTYPVDFIYSKHDKYNVTLTIPEGYAVESLPQPIHYTMANTGSFKYNITVVANQIQLVVNYEMNQSIIAPENYETLKNFFGEMIAKENEKVVLKRI